MSRPVLIFALAVLAAIAVGFGVAVSMREPRPEPPVAPRPSASATGEKRVTQGGTASGASEPAPAGRGEAAPNDAPEPAPSADPVAAALASDESDGRAIEQFEADLGLPPIDTTERSDAEECKALADDERRLNTSENMIAMLPEKNVNSIGAERLRALRDRLEREVGRRTALLARRGATCKD